MNKETFNKISEKYGNVASWAVWASEGDKPKSNIGDMSVLNLETNPKLLTILKPNIVMVGLNFAREANFDKPFMNFHDSNSRGQDYKLRFAFKDTEFYGAYMTDVIKNTPMVNSVDGFKIP